MPVPHTIGEHIDFSPDGHGTVKIPCIITGVDNEGYIMRLSARYPHESLCKYGFFQEGEEYVVINYEILTDN